MTTLPYLKDREGLTQRQRAIYRFIVSYLKEHQRPPTVREMCLAFGISSPNGVVCHLKALVKKGLLSKDDFRANGIVLCGVKVRLEFDFSEIGEKARRLTENL